jgi:hypothetical protein
MGHRVRRTIQALEYELVRVVVDKGKDDGVEHRLGYERGAWRERQQNAGCQNKKQHSREKGHHRVKHNRLYLCVRKKVRRGFKHDMEWINKDGSGYQFLV